MQFKFPENHIGDRVWFLSSKESLVFGLVKVITVAITEDGCKVYYRLVDEGDEEYTVEEAQVLTRIVTVPTPKYQVGDCVVYAAMGDDKKHYQFVDIIKQVEIGLFDKNTFEITYTMEHENIEWVMEEEILGFGEVNATASDDMPPVEDEEDLNQQYLGTGGSDM